MKGHSKRLQKGDKKRGEVWIEQIDREIENRELKEIEQKIILNTFLSPNI